MATLERIQLYPVKGLDGIEVDESDILPGGTLAFDREFAFFDAGGQVLNGKRTDLVHDLRTEFDPATTELTVDPPDGDTQQFNLHAERDRAERWFSEFFGVDLSLKRDETLGYVDRREMGPSVISTATIETVASWFDGLTVDGVRRRLRANLEISGVPAFWEDQFVGDDAPALTIGSVRLDGVTPCARCIVPERDPDTGELTESFRERFVANRRETFPEWADETAFDHYYTTMVLIDVPEADRGKQLDVGTAVEIVPSSS
jgi:hypothetical protein